ncbi:unnamed protein product [Echinostoma caproni]|uniref:Myosin motor domain-containing protein n=1 Tax=Echinostoma caproni TaxID=27848 RepID=A0A183B334_9TREM|nr:unnamed protein product [Echinostoma caproni]
MSAIGEIILKPPYDNAYDVLKAASLQFYTPNEERLHQLLTRHPFGDSAKQASGTSTHVGPPSKRPL